MKDITIRGLEIRDTAYTYLGTDTADLHGMPSGGDCARHPHIVSSVCSLSKLWQELALSLQFRALN